MSGHYRRTLPEIRGLVDFSSNDYLGLASSPELLEKYHAAIQHVRHGSSGSRLLTGNSDEAIATESYLASLWSSEAVLIFPSGYMANLGLLSAVATRHDTLLYDSLSHACIKDGVRLSQARSYSFRHNDLEHLEARLKKATGTAYVVVESIYSMDGDEAPLSEIAELCQRFDAHLIVDEAHATGIAGKFGGGLSEKYGIQPFARINTFGKAMGLHGASISGSLALKDLLINTSRPFIYTTAPPPSLFLQVRMAFQFLADHPELVSGLYERVGYFKQIWEKVIGTTPCFVTGNYAIHGVIFPGVENVRKAASKIQKEGFDVRPILPPTVKEGTERIRICIHNFNKKDEIEGLISAIKSNL